MTAASEGGAADCDPGSNAYGVIGRLMPFGSPLRSFPMLLGVPSAVLSDLGDVRKFWIPI
jgi:hypothetical protein